MKIIEQLFAVGALLGLSANGLVPPATEENILWAEVCGRPGMRVAIPLNGEPSNEKRDCAEACHAALCRKSTGDLRNGGARGAVV
ncbi:hypothetical protein [Parasphingopyxis lamellibrachiae]|uniref:Uncharacterized protein n=1 Tax=Parasphingopyxis lamellibrachiae TaxID=680125 RepID=A0A3D9FEY7_9SPHN|nr:hypothetical protein [Parasphingopyxis lamellibrachiae]RED16293.1 hypothetical protein DFR46_1315 [Parasphingopyxis lamellibrachiae]